MCTTKAVELAVVAAMTGVHKNSVSTVMVVVG